MSAAARPSGFEQEPPEVAARNLTAGSRLLASASVMFFLAWVFAYFYLRSLDNGGLWRPHGVDPSLALGTVWMLAALAAAVLIWLALRDDRAGRAAAAQLKSGIALGLGFLAVVLIVVGWVTEGFGPADGGFASVFIGWTAFYFLFLVGALFWLETVLATAIRHRSEPRKADGPELDALSFFWWFLAAVGFLTWLILYVI